MRRVLIVENKIKRLEDSLERKNLLKDFHRLCQDGVSLARQDVIDDLIRSKGSDTLPSYFIDSFDLLMIHTSFVRENLGEAKEEEFKKLPQTHKKDVVFFSGGTPETLYSFDPISRKTSMTINAELLYSKNLIDFLEKNKTNESINLLYLVDGDKWLLSFLLEARRQIHYFGYNEFTTNDYERQDIINLRNTINGEIKELGDIFNEDQETTKTTKGFQSEFSFGDDSLKQTGILRENKGEKYLNELNRQIDLIISRI